jgi:hypothetical protein
VSCLSLSSMYGLLYNGILLADSMFQTYDFIMSSDGSAVEEDPSPGSEKMRRVPEGFVLANVTGVRAHLVLRMDGRGYEISKRGFGHAACP